MPCFESSCFSIESDTLYDHVIFLKEIKLRFIMSSSVACCQVISNVSEDIIK